jgi:glycosyltransferase involved in cell wall biosynthesis
MTAARPPAVSLVVTTYENPALAERCLRSILGQSLAEKEIVVCDDSTSRDIEDLVGALRAAGAAIDYRPGARTGNPVDNWNKGLDQARGAYSVLVHHDERFTDPHWLARASATLDRAPGRAIAAGAISPGIDGRSRFGLVSAIAARLHAPPWTLYLANWIGPTAVLMFPTRLGLRFDPELVWLVDVDFYARLWALTGPFIRERAASVVSEPHHGQITADLDTHSIHRREARRLATAAGGPLTATQHAAIRLSLDLRASLPRRPRRSHGR